MKLSAETLGVLKNFSTINKSIEFKASNILKTISPTRTVLATATLSDTMTDAFCVEDLNEFLSVHSLFDDKADLTFDDYHIFFKNGKKNLKYRKTEKTAIVTPPDKDLNFPTEDVKFTLSAEDYDWVLKTSKVLSSTHVAIQSDGETIEIVSFNADIDSAHTNSTEIGQGDGTKYKIVFSIDNLKMVPGTYDVTICFRGITHFKNTNGVVQYWVAQEEKHSNTGE